MLQEKDARKPGTNISSNLEGYFLGLSSSILIFSHMVAHFLTSHDFPVMPPIHEIQNRVTPLHLGQGRQAVGDISEPVPHAT